MNSRANTIPVTILTGFLGSGKTTLLNHIIKSQPQTKFAIIENEFGAVPIDNDLVITNEEDLFTLENGCICCSLQSDILDILVRLALRNESVDHVLIESTGVADPAPVAQLFINRIELQHFYRLEGVICLVDAINFKHQIKDQPETVKQLVMADLIVINKTEKVSDEEVCQLEKQLRSYNHEADILQCDHARISIDRLLSIKAYDLGEVENSFLASASPMSLAPTKNHTAHEHTHSEHNIQTFSIQFKAALNFMKFNNWLNDFVALHGHKLYRSKGVIHTSTSDHKIIFQSVHHEIDGMQGSKWGNEERSNKMVFIGKGLDESRTRKGVLQCLA